MLFSIEHVGGLHTIILRPCLEPLNSDFKQKKPNNPAKHFDYQPAYLDRNRRKILPTTAFRNAAPTSLILKRAAFPLPAPLLPHASEHQPSHSSAPTGYGRRPVLPATGRRRSPRCSARPALSALLLLRPTAASSSQPTAPAASVRPAAPSGSAGLEQPPCCVRGPAAPAGQLRPATGAATSDNNRNRQRPPVKCSEGEICVLSVMHLLRLWLLDLLYSIFSIL